MARRFRYPQTGALMRHFQEGDFLDSQIAPVADGSLQAADIAIITFFTMPKWVLALLWMRNALVRPFGINTGEAHGYAPPTREDLVSGRYEGVFAIDFVSEEEITFGTDDVHLNFRVSVIRTREPRDHAAITTWVHPHNWLGRLYLVAVYPFHKLIVWRMLANLKDRQSGRIIQA
ncbi:DUF2867 domain-containing protein [Pelagibacterium sediminicola]|uniref:DUF2867 domain-containing protein n=1 Tax=Pelagibacterium sediminicola TaxID=2248761 RepID=UPI00130082AF|nr:DUF2867 domain-containing protein [Pelagibacterium sediminicola]